MTEKSFSEKSCPKCGFYQMKSWKDLNDEEKIIVEKLPKSAEFSLAERKNNLWCPRCWFENIHYRNKLA